MPLLTFGVLAVDQLAQWRYGTAGALAIGLLTIGHKARNTTLTCAGLAVMAVLLAR